MLELIIGIWLAVSGFYLLDTLPLFLSLLVSFTAGWMIMGGISEITKKRKEDL